MRRCLPVLALAMLGGCGNETIHELPPAAEPPRAPLAAAPAAGRVVRVGTQPEGVVIDPLTHRIAVALRDPPVLAIVDEASGRVVHRTPLPGAPRHLALKKPGGPFLVPAETAGRFLAVDPRSGAITRNVRVGAYPHGLVAADGKVFVADERGNALSVVAGGRVAKTLPVATQPGGIAALDGGREIAVVSVRERTLELFDARSYRRLGSAPAGVGPTHAACLDRGPCYVLDTAGDALLVYAVAPKLAPERRLYLPGGPYGIALDERHHRLWVTVPGRNELLELPADGRPHVLRRFPSVRQPDTVAVDPSTGVVAVTGRTGGVLELLRP